MITPQLGVLSDHHGDDRFRDLALPAAPLPADEIERLASLRASGVLDTPPDPRFDAFTRLAARFFSVPVALVSMVDERRQWFKAALGGFRPGGETHRDVAFCAYAILQPEGPLVIEDATRDPRFADNPLVTGEPGIRFYAGAPLRDRDGRALGTLSILDNRPRRLSPDEVETLCDLANGASSTVELYRNAVALRESEEHYRCTVELNPQFPWTADPDGNVLEVSPRIAALTGLALTEIVGTGWTRLLHPDDLATAWRRWSECVRSGEPYDAEYRVRAAGGSYQWFRASAGARRGADGGILRWYGTAEDIMERKRSETQLAYLAHHDATTGLSNGVLFRERLEQKLARVGRGGARLAVLSIDLDHFKAVNDALGHSSGDALLSQVAERLRACVRETDTVARFGSDEFAVIQTRLVQPGGAAALARRIISVLGAPYELDGRAVAIGASIGVALAPQDGSHCDALCRNADSALHRAKAEGRGTFRFFEPAMDERLRARQALKLVLGGALGRSEIDLAYQPLVDLRSGRVSCFEALLRWRHPERGLVSPGEFVSLAEETGLIAPIGEWALVQACREAAARWPSGVGVAVNLSPVQFRNRDLARIVASALATSGLAPERLELEITESVLMLDDDANLDILHGLRRLGVWIAMDDFGTGYSSLSYLHRFRFDKLKIDRSLVSALSEVGASRAIIRAIIGLSRALGIATTAEGVETRQQLELLAAEGCDRAQGYLFSRPVPAREVELLIAAIEGAGERS